MPLKTFSLRQGEFSLDLSFTLGFTIMRTMKSCGTGMTAQYKEALEYHEHFGY